MAKISTYGIDASPTLNDKVIGTRVEDNNNTYNYTLGDIYGLFQAQGGGGNYVPYTGATDNVNLGLKGLKGSELAAPIIDAEKIVPLDTLIYTEYEGAQKGLYLDYNFMGSEEIYALGDLFTGPTSTALVTVNTQQLIVGLHNGNPNGMYLDFNQMAFGLGDLQYANNGTNLIVSDTSGFERVSTRYNDTEKGLTIDFANNLYSLGDTYYVNNGLSLQIDDQYVNIVTKHQGNYDGLYLNFDAFSTYALGDFNCNTLGNSLVIGNNGSNNTIWTNSNCQQKGLYFDFSANLYSIGDMFSHNNGTYLRVNDSNQRIEITKALYTSGSEGSVGQVLVSQGTVTAPQWQTIPAISPKYGSFYDTTTQTCVSGTATPMKYNTTVNSAGVSIQNDLGGKPTQILFNESGIYNIQFSAQLNRTSGGTDAQIDIWLRKQGVDIPYTNTSLTVKAGAKNLVAAWNFFETFAAGEYAEIMWTQDDNVQIIQYSPNLTVPFPATPSVILTVNRIA